MNERAILKLLKDRYFLKNEETWEQLAERVSNIYPPIKEYIKNKWFIPSSPTLMNGGTSERKGTLSSCFPMQIEDSIEGIFESLKEGALVTKSGGGVGYDFSSLRGSGENILSLSANSSGPLAFIENFNSMLDSIRQGGKRRGAGMALLSIEHPNILEFIKVKDDTSKINRLNLSIKIPSSFYEKLEKDPNGPHMVRSKNGLEYAVQDKTGKTYTTQEVWNLIIKQAWKCAEPGIFNETIAHDRCTVTNLNDKVICNPCLRDSVVLLTKSGLRELQNINIGDEIWSSEGWTQVINKWKTGNKEVFNYYTTAGLFESTENHEVISNGIKIPINDAKTIDILTGNSFNINNFDVQLIMDGLVLGDGSVHKASNNLIYLFIGQKDEDYFKSEIATLILKDRKDAFKTGWEIKTTLSYDELPKTYNRCIPKRFMELNSTEICSFLRGLYSANGSVCGKRITYKSTSFKLIKQIQILLSSIGISSYYTTNKSSKVEFKNGMYTCKESYDLNIGSCLREFYDSIGFIQKYKMNKLYSIIKDKKIQKASHKKSFEIIKKESLGIFPVYDITVNNISHTFWCNGFNISNCSEFTGIPYQSCNLGSINLMEMLDGSKFNWERFTELIKESTRFIDNAININIYPLEKIKETTLATRPIGLGTMGLAHVLFKKKIPYNSEKAIKFTEDLFRYFTLTSMKESVLLAREYAESETKIHHEIGTSGAYCAFNYDLFMRANERFFTKNCRDIDIDHLKKDIKKYGVRNSCFTSQAPTGTISFLADVSSGIEPVFGLVYSRKIEKLNKEYEVVYLSDPIFEEYLNENFSAEAKIKIMKEVAENSGSCQTCKDIPEEMRKVFVTAGDLKPMEHLNILEAVANNVSLSVSKTINMPSSITQEEISEVFLEAHKRGIIGVTCYRDGCREGILLHDNGNDGLISLRDAPKRPKELPCEIHRVIYQGKMWIVFVGMYENKPFEVFAGAVEDVNIPKNITEGFIVKQKSSHYSFKFDDEIIVNNIMKTFANKEYDAFARSISLELRHFIPLKYIVSTLNKSEGGITHFAKVIARTLKKYISDGEDAGKCQQCGSKLIYFDGCVNCSNMECGFSKCG